MDRQQSGASHCQFSHQNTEKPLMSFLGFMFALTYLAVIPPSGHAVVCLPSLKDKVERVLNKKRNYGSRRTLSGLAVNAKAREKVTAGSRVLYEKLRLLQAADVPDGAKWEHQVDKILFDFQIANLDRKVTRDFILYLRSKLISKNVTKQFLKDPRKIITDFVREQSGHRLLRGKVIPTESLPVEDGFANVLSIETFYKHYISPNKKHDLEIKYGISSLEEFAELLGTLSPSGTRELLQSMMAGQSTFKNGFDMLWWSHSMDCSGATSKDVIQKLALDPKSYPTGMIRITINPSNLSRAGINFHKPTAIDGLPYLEWKHSTVGHHYGLTEGDLNEAVSGPIPVSMISFLEFVP